MRPLHPIARLLEELPGRLNDVRSVDILRPVAGPHFFERVTTGNEPVVASTAIPLTINGIRYPGAESTFEGETKEVRGTGGQISSCGEENLLSFPDDPYSTENLLIHELAHTIHDNDLNDLITDFDKQINEAYEKAIKAGLWKDTYAGTNAHEYWAEGVQSWFDNNRPKDSIHNGIDTREELKEYDPALAALCEKVFGDGPWRYHKPMDRPEDQRAHLQGYDPEKAPEFRWRDGSASR